MKEKLITLPVTELRKIAAEKGIPQISSMRKAELVEKLAALYEAEQEISPAEFRKKIGQALPKYMIPTVYNHLDLLQRNTNGKIDRLYYKNLVNA